LSGSALDRPLAALKDVRATADNQQVERPPAAGPSVRPWTYPILGAALACLVVTLAVTGVAAAQLHTRAKALDTAIVDQVNAVRSQAGLRALRVNGELASAARAHSSEMASLGYFSHTSADGRSMADRVRASYPAGRRWAVGENLLWSSPGVGSARSVTVWMASPEHRAIVLSAAWRDVGCGAVHIASAPGVYGNQPATIVTCDFGVRG